MKNLNEVMRILGGSKRFDFEYNENGYSCNLVVSSYHSGEEVRLDLSKLDNEMLEALQVEDNDNEEMED